MNIRGQKRVKLKAQTQSDFYFRSISELPNVSFYGVLKVTQMIKIELIIKQKSKTNTFNNIILCFAHF